MDEIPIRDAGKYVDVTTEFGEDCTVFLDTREYRSGDRAKLNLLASGSKPYNVKICLLKNGSGVRLNIGGSNNLIFVGRYGYAFNTDINIWNNSRIFIGDESTCNYARIVLDNSSVLIGCDSMLSDEIILQSADQHGIIDISTMKIVNNIHKTMRIGRHVWIGRRSIVMPGCEIGEGSIVGAGSIVTKNIDKHSICAGAPARVVKSGMSWSRSTQYISPDEAALLQSFLT